MDSSTDFTIKNHTLVKYNGHERNVIVPYGVTEISIGAFDHCYSVQTVTLPNSVTRLRTAFVDCPDLVSVFLPDSLAEIRGWPYCRCPKINLHLTEYNGGQYFGNVGNPYMIMLISGPTAAIHPQTVIIDCNSFHKCKDIGALTIPNNVVTIGEDAFHNCKSMTSVTIGNNVKRIGTRAFLECTQLTSVTIPDSVTDIDDAAFACCIRLTSVFIGKNVNNIHRDAFSGCHKLASLTVDAANTTYHSAGNCIIETASKTLILGCATSIIPTDGSVTSIGQNAFQECSGLKAIIIPDAVTTIDCDAFYGCKKLKTVIIPDSVTEIQGGAFEGCTELTSVIIPDSVTKIGWGAFENCESLTSVTIPESVTEIGRDAFYGCSKLTHTDYNGGQYLGNAGNPYIILIKGTATSGIHPDTKIIYHFAFCECADLTSITIPNSVVGIGDAAFSGCAGLTSVTIPDSVTEIGRDAFGGCSSLTSITIPDSVTNIGEAAFLDCSCLPYTYYNGGQYLGKTGNPYMILIKGTATSGIHPDTKFIYPNAFEECAGLTSVTIPTGVITIGCHAFKGCKDLTSVKIPDSVTNIGEAAFYGCSSLTTVTIPNHVTVIDDKTFYFCDGLTSVTIPDSVTKFNFCSFGCKDLTAIHYNGAKSAWNAIEKNEEWYSSDHCAIHCTDGDIDRI